MTQVAEINRRQEKLLEKLAKLAADEARRAAQTNRGWIVVGGMLT